MQGNQSTGKITITFCDVYWNPMYIFKKSGDLPTYKGCYTLLRDNMPIVLGSENFKCYLVLL